MAAFRLGAAMGVAAVGSWIAAVGNIGVHAPAPGGAFGGGSPVHIGHVGHIDVDLEPARLTGLRRMPCAGAPLGTACFVGSARH